MRVMSIGSRPLVPSRVASGGVVHGSRESRSRVGAFVALTKPRIIELLLITTVPTMVLAQNGWPSTTLVIFTLIGGALAAGGANTINMYVDRDIDALMERTRHRPLVTGVVKPKEALIFAFVLESAAVAVLWASANLLSALLALSATVFYVGVYTLWLKRTSRQNIVIGGAAGAVPVLVGWAAVTNGLTWEPVVLFAVIFFWTPPHFWALALRYADDYRSANVPMLPAIVPFRAAHVQMIAHTVALVASSVLVALVSSNIGAVYLVSAGALGAAFLAGTIRLGRNPSESASMRLFGFSITYITLLFAALTIDVLL